MNPDQKIARYSTEKSLDTLSTSLGKACSRIAPLWSLQNFVAVNPYMGVADMSFEEAAHRLHQLGEIRMTLPVAFYRQALSEGMITDKDLLQAIQKSFDGGHWTLEEVKSGLENYDEQAERSDSIDLLVDAASEIQSKDWNTFFIDRMTSWASVYFDEGQAIWNTAKTGSDIYTAWRTEAMADATPEIMGLRGYRKQVTFLPEDPEEALIHALNILNIPEELLEYYFHGLLLRTSGWSAFVARKDWDAGIKGEESDHLQLFLTVLLCREAVLYRCLDNATLRNRWEQAIFKMKDLMDQSLPTRKEQFQLILQAAYDHATERTLVETFENRNAGIGQKAKKRPDVQAVFCIDVRSEVFRRNLESAGEHIETLGFAGFFGFPVSLKTIGREKEQAQCPVLIAPGPTVKETTNGTSDPQKAINRRQFRHQIMRSWKSFKLGAISCFSFMGPVGLAYLFKMFTDAFGLSRPVAHPENEGLSREEHTAKDVELEVEERKGVITGLALDDKINMAKGALSAMSLSSGFARLVLIAGHGSTTVNNPYATGLDCGACGGSTGEANAKVAAKVLNDPEVRKGLRSEGIEIPDDTIFLAGLHDTTTDEVALFHTHRVPISHHDDLEELIRALKKAGHGARAERAARLQIEAGEDVKEAIFRRSNDWSQVRPEWGLAGCKAFIVAPRERTQGINMEGKSFLHNYSWEQDEDFSVLELIMTAPMVVTSWINLQYYASTVDNQKMGSGNKTLHNVTGGFGVLEGFAGDLRTGLPLQSVHDGEEYQHLPQRLNVVIEAPTHAMNAILENHSSVRDLCDNGWINLLAMNEAGKIHKRYAGQGTWVSVKEEQLQEA